MGEVLLYADLVRTNYLELCLLEEVDALGFLCGDRVEGELRGSGSPAVCDDAVSISVTEQEFLTRVLGMYVRGLHT